jgi:hypothetical protein
MKRAKGKKRRDFEFAARLGNTYLRLQFDRPDRQTAARLLKAILVIVLALLILFAPRLWDAIQRALALVH